MSEKFGIEPSQKLLNFSVERLFFVLFTLIGVFSVLYLGKNFLIPLLLGLLLSFILYPVCRFIEKKINSRSFSIIITYVFVIFLISGVMTLFSTQLVSISKDFGGFSDKIHQIIASITTFINERFTPNSDISNEEVLQVSKEWLKKKSELLVSGTLSNTSAIVIDLFMTAIYTFLFLLYRSGLKRALSNFVSEDKKQVFHNMLNNIQKVGQRYLTGMFIVVLILGVLNTLGLLIIGLEYAFFFGFLAAILTIIPYVGTIIGGAIPTVYAFMTFDSWVYPVAVIGVFWLVQAIEGNFLSPKIIGGHLSLNPLLSIMALLIGSLIWGVPGMILSLPYLAIVKVASDHYEELTPVAFLLGEKVEQRKKETGGILEKIKKVFDKS